MENRGRRAEVKERNGKTLKKEYSLLVRRGEWQEINWIRNFSLGVWKRFKIGKYC